MELDVHATGDVELVVHHDPVLPGLGPIASLSWSRAASHRLSNGETVPTLAEALGLLKGLEVWVEVKALPPQVDQRLFATLDAGPTPGKYAVHSFDHRIIARLGEHRPSLRRGVLLASYLLDPLAPITGTGADTLWMDAQLIDQELVGLVQDDGYEIIAWTANQPAEIARLVTLGVDGICGNYPERIRDALARPRA